MYQGINTLKSRWFRVVLGILAIEVILWFSVPWLFIFAFGWEGDGFLANPLGLALFYGPFALTAGTLIFVGISILVKPPAPRAWYVQFGIWLAFLAGINSGVVAWQYNDGQIPYLFFYTVFVTLGLLALDGYLLYFVVRKRSKLQPASGIAPITQQVMQPTALPTQNKPTPKNKLAVAIAVVFVLQILTAFLTYTEISDRNYIKEYGAFVRQCLSDGKYPMVHGYRNGKESIRSASGFVGWQLVENAKFHCYSTLDEALKDYPNFYEIIDKYDQYQEHLSSQKELDLRKNIPEAERIISIGPIGKKYLRPLWIRELPDGIELARVIFGYSTSDGAEILPWRAEYISDKDNGSVNFSCAETDNPLLWPKGFDVNGWHSEKMADKDSGTYGQPLTITNYSSGNKKLWLVRRQKFFKIEEARGTDCVLYDELGTIEKAEGDDIIKSIEGSLVKYYPAESEAGEIVIDTR